MVDKHLSDESLEALIEFLSTAPKGAENATTVPLSEVALMLAEELQRMYDVLDAQLTGE